MNAPPLNDFRSASASDLTDEKMDQIRELLIGDTLRRLNARITQLETRLVAVEGGIARRLDTLEGRLDAMTGAAEGDRRATFEALAQSVSELGEQIRRISRG